MQLNNKKINDFCEKHNLYYDDMVYYRIIEYSAKILKIYISIIPTIEFKTDGSTDDKFSFTIIKGGKKSKSSELYKEYDISVEEAVIKFVTIYGKI